MEMKTYKNYILAILSATAVAACGSDSDVRTSLPDEPVEISLSSGLSVEQSAGTRAVADASGNKNLQDQQFVSSTTLAENAVAVYVEEASASPTTAYVNAAKYVPDGDGNLTISPIKQYYPSSGNGVRIYAYYPYQSTDLVPATARARSVGAIPFAVQANQKEFANYAKSDLMYGTPNKLADNTAVSNTTGVARTSKKVNLHFHHLLSKVTIVVKTDGTFQTGQLNGATVTIGGTKLKANFNFNTGALVATTTKNYVTTADNDASPITVMTLTESGTNKVEPTNASGAGQSGSAIVVPQVVAAGQKFIIVTLGTGGGGGEFYYKAPTGGITLQPGKAYRYTVTLTSAEIKLTSTIESWGSETARDGINVKQDD